VLKVTDDASGIQGVMMDKNNSGKTFTLSGIPVKNPAKKGIYIKNGKKIIIK
jgi:hypothetical protein